MKTELLQRAGNHGEQKPIRMSVWPTSHYIDWKSVNGLYVQCPQDSARTIFSEYMQVVCAYIGLLLVSMFSLFPATSVISFQLGMTFFFLTVLLFRLYLAVAAFGAHAGDDPDITTLNEKDLPVITILLPLYDEAQSLLILLKAIERLDYPKDKLDVKLLLERDDILTIAAAAALDMPPYVEEIHLPPSLPRTKPKACNHGLLRARGAFIVIYDAEDIPQADQLKKAVALFAKSDRRTACVQARLNYYNADENILTRLFALEYALWFDHLLPALDKIGAPIPLGGTSNIFRTDVLHKIGGWDPYNVTEDADLGMRLARYGYRTALLTSTTFEEANSRLGNWMRQRSRWLKGYMQTWLVMMRAPGKMIAAVGWSGFAAAQLFLAGTVLIALCNPVLWGGFLFSLWWSTGHGMPGLAGAVPDFLWQLNAGLLIFGNGVFILLAAIAPHKRGWWHLVPYALLTPFYWLLTSIAAYKGLWQLFHRPHYWEKTSHMLSDAATTARCITLSSR